MQAKKCILYPTQPRPSRNLPALRKGDIFRPRLPCCIGLAGWLWPSGPDAGCADGSGGLSHSRGRGGQAARWAWDIVHTFLFEQCTRHRLLRRLLGAATRLHKARAPCIHNCL